MNARQQLLLAAQSLGELTERVVFVGGATVDLFITDLAAGPPRFTADIDLIVEVGSRSEFYSSVEEVLRKQGFKQDMRDGAPICRWMHAELVIDVMPTTPEVLGFTNRWYESGMAHAHSVELAEGVAIRVLAPPYFLATKIEAFKSRGQGDFLASADIEDIVRLVDGRPELTDEIRQSSTQLRTYLQQELKSLLGSRAFMEALPGHLMGDAVSQERATTVIDRLRASLVATSESS